MQSGGIPQSLISLVLLGQSTIQERFKEVRMAAEGWCRRSFTQWYQFWSAARGPRFCQWRGVPGVRTARSRAPRGAGVGGSAGSRAAPASLQLIPSAAAAVPNHKCHRCGGRPGRGGGRRRRPAAGRRAGAHPGPAAPARPRCSGRGGRGAGLPELPAAPSAAPAPRGRAAPPAERPPPAPPAPRRPGRSPAPAPAPGPPAPAPPRPHQPPHPRPPPRPGSAAPPPAGTPWNRRRPARPKFAIALRTSGHLLLGVVRIYNRKAKYLLADCNEALTKMKTAFRPGLLDLPEENFEAAYQSITLPEEFHDFEAPLPDVKAIDVAEHFTLNQSRAEEITLTEDYESSILLGDRNFDEEAVALKRQNFFEGSVLTSSNSLVADPNSASTSRDKSVLHEDVYSFQDDHFGDEEDAADMIVESNCADTTVKDVNHTMSETILLFQEEGFVLESVDDTAVTQRKKKKRKRKLLVDVEKELSCHTIYKQLTNYTDLLATLDLAPPTKKTMMWKEWGGVDKLLSHSSQPMLHAQLQKLFEKCFKTDRFKMRANGIQSMSEIKEMRKEQDTTEMLPVEEPSYLKEPAHSETGRKIINDSFMLTSQNDRNETNENCGEIIEDGAAFSESSKNSLGQEAEAQQVEVPEEQTVTRKDNEEIRWGKRTLRLQKTLQQLKRSGMCSFSFRELCRRNNRKEAAATFYIFLVLKKQEVVKLQQPEPFADLTATAGPMFDKIR
ncbi:double-strand-break repair protein rad21-like protein 1 isoform X2 [Anomalospiza imberbis]|uniref:double-strand-break repair protein rad21-like protein 1 isoform X2 n=1 Tax=Anomalospiza imberbis TaxID=187417 RepID=UPI00358F8C17